MKIGVSAFANRIWMQTELLHTTERKLLNFDAVTFREHQKWFALIQLIHLAMELSKLIGPTNSSKLFGRHCLDHVK